MSREELEKAVDTYIERLTLGDEADVETLGSSLSEEEREELRRCADAARWLETAIVDTSRKSMSQSRLLDSGAETLSGGAIQFARHETYFSPGQSLGDFEIVREIGRGGMGIVFEAREKSLERRVALKVLPPGISWNETALERFVREARAAGRLQHSNIIPVYQIQHDKGVHFYAMQFIDGFALNVLARTPYAPTHPQNGEAGTARAALAETWPELLPEPTDPAYYRFAARVMLQAARAIDYAHQCGILHRDIKPSNLLIDRNREVWIADFGLARLSTDHSMTISGQLIGTLNYMSPEQAGGGKHVDSRADIYSLGATLYELLTLRSPFISSSTQELLNAIQEREPTHPSKINPRVPRDLEVIALKAMEKDPARRYASAGELGQDLQRFLDDQPIRARPAPLWRRSAKWLRRQRTAATAVGVVLLVVAASALMLRGKQKQVTQLSQQSAAAQLEKAEGMTSTAQRLFDEQRYADAAVKFQDAAAIFSQFLTGTDRFGPEIKERVKQGAEALPFVYLGLIRMREMTSEAQELAAQDFEQALLADPDNVLLRSLKELAGTQDYDRAQAVIRNIETFPVARDLGPFAADGYLALATAMEQHDLGAAIRMAGRALEARTGFLQALFTRGVLEYRAGLFGEALTDLEFVCFADRGHAEAFLWRGLVNEMLGKHDAAGADLAEAVRLAPTSFLTHAERLLWLLRRANGAATDTSAVANPAPLAPEAAAALDAMRELSPARFEDHYQLARVLEAVGASNEAAAVFEQAVAAMPAGSRGRTAGELLVAAARMQNERGMHDAARGLLNRAIAAWPDRNSFRARADHFLARGAWSDAASDYANALRRGEGDAATHLAYARSLLETDQLDQAFVQLRMLATAPSPSLDVLSLLAEVELRRGNDRAAVNHVSRYLMLNPRDPAGFERRAGLLLASGDEEAARADLHTALELRGSSGSEAGALATLYQKLGKPERALEIYREAIGDPADGDALRAEYVRLLMRLGRLEEASKACSSSGGAASDEPILLMLGAECCERLGREREAIDGYERVVALRPADPEARWRLASLLLYAKEESLRDPSRVEGLLCESNRRPTELDERIRAHYCYALGRLEESAGAIERVSNRELVDWLLVSVLQSRGLLRANVQPPAEGLNLEQFKLPSWFPLNSGAGAEQATTDKGEQGAGAADRAGADTVDELQAESKQNSR